MKMQFELFVKNGTETLAHVEGRHIDPAHISIEDGQRVIEVEQYLERILGYRFHINVKEYAALEVQNPDS